MALHALGDSVAGTEPQTLETFVDTINDWLAQRLQTTHSDTLRMLRLAEVWQRINQAVREANTYNLERKPLVFRVFGWLAEAARG
jgi:DNA polymerase-3 subunit delta'